METYYKVYYNSKLDEGVESIAFIVITDGDKYGIAFPEGTDEDTASSMCAAIGARIYAVKSNKTDATPADILDFIPYNMMFINASEDDEAYDTWEDASKSAEDSLTAQSYGFMDWSFKLYEPTFPDFSNKDTEIKE